MINELGDEVNQNDFYIDLTNPIAPKIVGTLTIADIDPWFINSPHTYSLIAQLG